MVGSSIEARGYGSGGMATALARNPFGSGAVDAGWIGPTLRRRRRHFAGDADRTVELGRESFAWRDVPGSTPARALPAGLARPYAAAAALARGVLVDRYA